MLPLDPLAPTSSIGRLLQSAPAVEVRAELARLDAFALDDLTRAARLFAGGALALREGALDLAHADLSSATDAFARAGQREAAALARCEAILAQIRRGPRAVFAAAASELGQIADDAANDARVRAIARHYQGTATRMSGDAIGTQRMLLEALRIAEDILDERARILNSLGTLYVVMGAFGAAQAILEHAAELHHQLGDVVGEAIACGQLGAAALGLRDFERARRCLQKQEWLAGRVGDAVGRARALTFLADVALELGRPDDAVILATTAREAASATSPPLRMFVAYATRAIGRARTELGDPGAAADLAAASDLFAAIGNPLGSALTEWDRARLLALEDSVASNEASPCAPPHVDAQGPSWSAAAWALGSLGLAPRVTQLLREQRALVADTGISPARASEMAIAAVAQAAPHHAVAQEVELVYANPEELSSIAARRTAAQRNLGRLAALTIAPHGLFFGVLASRSIGSRGAALPPERASGALAGQLPGIAAWVWPMSTPLVAVAHDLAALFPELGEDVRAVLSAAPFGRVVAPPFAGEVSAELAGVELHDAIVLARTLERGALFIDPTIDWSQEADALTAAAGYTTRV